MNPCRFKIAGNAGKTPGVRGRLIRGARPFAGLLFLSVLAASAPPEVPMRSGRTTLVQVARVSAPEGADFGLLNRATLAEPLPLASRPVDEARRDAASMTFKEFSGGPAGTLLIGAGLLAAVALILAAVIPW
jgi:hypothetical protein